MVKAMKIDVHSRLSSQQGRTFENRSDVTPYHSQAKLFTAQEHMGNPGVHRDLGHGASVSGECAFTIQCTQIAQEATRPSKMRRRWRVDEPESCCFRISPPGELECEWCEVSVQDFRYRVR
jgi:hypothetical protein